MQELNPLAYAKITLKTKKVLLITNPRYISPTFNTFLFQNQDILDISSISNLTTNYTVDEIPLNPFSIFECINGKLNLENTTVVTSYLDNVLIY